MTSSTVSLFTVPDWYGSSMADPEQRFVLHDPLGWCRIVQRCTECDATLSWNEYNAVWKYFGEQRCTACHLAEIQENIRNGVAQIFATTSYSGLT